MTGQERQHAAERGLLDSGLVVSIIRSSADLDAAVLMWEKFVTIAMPGNPCGVLLCCSIQAPELAKGVAELRGERR